MSLRLLFEPEHKATMRLLCDVLEVTGAGGKVPRWVIMGRELLGFQRDRFDDAYSFLTWARDGQKMTIAELIGAIENYAGGAILSKLRDMAAIKEERIVYENVPLRLYNGNDVKRMSHYFHILDSSANVLCDQDMRLFSVVHGITASERASIAMQANQPGAMIDFLQNHRFLCIDNLQPLVDTFNELHKRAPEEFLEYQRVYGLPLEADSMDVAVVSPPPQPVMENNNNDPTGKCVICLENDSSTVLLPCAHQCLCSACALSYKNGTKNCPICRTHAAQTIQVFRV